MTKVKTVLVAARIPVDIVRFMDQRGRRTDVIIAALESWLGMTQAMAPVPAHAASVGIPGVFLGSQLEQHEPEILPPLSVCGKTWWEDGEQYECLMESGHRNPKHGQGGLSRKIDE